ncbi:coiled-coil domain-containing protein 42 [Aegotheles albertisi]
MDDEDLIACYRERYRQNLLPWIREPQVPKASPSHLVRHQEAKKQLERAQRALEEKEEEFKEKMKVIARRWEELHARAAEQQTHWEKWERTIKENDEVLRKALKKASTNRELNMQKDKELLRAKKELAALRTEHQKLSSEVQNYSIFHKYLEEVVKISKFEDVEEVFEHYKTLVRTRKDLLHSQEHQKAMAEQAKVLQERKRNSLQQSPGKDTFFLAKERSESPWADIQNRASKKAQQLATIKMGIFSLAQSASTQLKPEVKVPMDDSHRQLDMIQQVIQDLSDLFMEIKQKELQDLQQAPAKPSGTSQRESPGQPRHRKRGRARGQQRAQHT